MSNRTKRCPFYLLTAILLLAFFLRFLATRHGYPPNHPDEPVVWSLAYNLIKNRDLNPHRFDYPMFSMVVNAFSYLSFFIPLALTKTALLNTGAFLKNLNNLQGFLDTYILRGEFSPVLLWGRSVSVFWGSATILAVYLMAKEAFDDLVGLIAAFLLAFNYRHLIASTLTLPDVFNTFLHALAFYFFLLLLRKPSRKLYVLSGISIGLIFATKYQAMIVLPFGLIHLYLALKEKKLKKILRKILAKDFFLSLICMAVSFFLINPYILIDFKEAYRWITWDAKRYEVGVIRLRLTPLWYLYEIVLGRLVAWAAILGLFLGMIIKKYRLKTILFFTLFLAFFFALAIYTHGVFYGRNYTPLLPFILTLAALSIAEVSRNKLILAGFLTVMVGFSPIKDSLTTAYYWSQDWNKNCAKVWMLENLSSQSKVGIVPPTPMDAFASKKATWVFYEPKYNFTLPEVQEEEIDYLVINLNPLGVYLIHWFDADNQFWEMPVEILDNSLVGLVLKEMSRYSVKECTKPWPVQDHNFIIVKVPSESDLSSAKLLKTYFFDEKDGQFPSGWQAVTALGDDLTGFSWEESPACRKGGCLKIEAGTNYIHKPARFVSEAIPVTAGEKYLVEGWIKSENTLASEERNGFIRVDFYKDQLLANGQRGMTAAVSGRVWGESDWQKKWLEAVAPKQAKFMRISLQHESVTTGFLFDEIRILQTEATKEEKKIANKKEIDSHHVYSETLF